MSLWRAKTSARKTALKALNDESDVDDATLKIERQNFYNWVKRENVRDKRKKTASGIPGSSKGNQMYARINKVIAKKLPAYLAKAAKTKKVRKITQAHIYSKIVPQIVRDMYQSEHRDKYSRELLPLSHWFDPETEAERCTSSRSKSGSDGYRCQKLRKNRFSK